MSDRLPPLTALRAFEAAARHMSFAEAANELNVTPAALSFQIKSLEEHLGHPVFRRLNRAVELTEAGRALAPGTSEGFGALTSAWRRAQRATQDRHLNVTAGPAFTSLWLAPRLYSFASAHPNIELRFLASLRVMDFDRDEVDVAIRFGKGTDEGLYSKPLREEWMTPMVAPELAEKLKSPEDLRNITLVHDDLTAGITPIASWDAWFKAAGIGAAPDTGPRFNQTDHSFGAAVAGVGAILGRLSLTEGALRDGRLVTPFVLCIQIGASYRILCPKGSETQPTVAAFLYWLESELAALETFDEGRRILSAKEVEALIHK